MPRATFATSALDGMTPGLSKLAQAIAGGDQAYQAGYENAGLYQSRMAQALAQVKQSNASADHHGAQAELERGKLRTLDRRPGLFEEQTANLAGVDIPTVQAYRQQLSTGQAPQVPMGPEAPDGSMGQGSFVLPAATKTKLAGALQQFLPLLANSGDLKPDDLSKAAGDFRTMSLSDAIIAGRADRNTVGGAQAAAAGKDLFKTDTTGAVLDQFTGGLNTTNPMAQSTISLRGAQAGQARASAADHYAGVSLKKAQTAEVGAGTGKAPSGYRWSADGKALEAIPGGPAADGKAPTEGERKAGSLLMRLRGSQQQLQDVLKASPGASKPGYIAETFRTIGGETAANNLTSEARQRVEAAQIDMLDAALTLGTGAAYTREQLLGYTKAYFPQLGDDPMTVADKRDRLNNVIRAAEIAAGRAAPLVGKATSAPAPAASGFKYLGPEN